jgi:polyvinyl alcohol dehydrogenase (cytochrome)
MRALLRYQQRTQANMTRAICLLLTLVLIDATATAQSLYQSPVADPQIVGRGAAVYAARCAGCHDNPSGRTPAKAALTITKSPDVVLRALSTGSMRQLGATLNTDDRNAVATYLAGKPLGAGADIDINANRCRGPQPTVRVTAADWNGWGGTGVANSRHHRDSGISAQNVDRLRLQWAFAYPGGAPGQPTVVGNHVFLPGMAGIVFALDARSGCTFWATDVGAQLRSIISIGTDRGGRQLAFIGDMRGVVHALDARTGKEIWRSIVEDHPMVRLTGSVTYADGRLYVPVSSLEERAVTMDPKYVCCSFRGSMVALDASTGRRLWKSPTLDGPLIRLPDGRRTGPAGAAIWNTPTVDLRRGLVYAGTGNAYTEPATETTDAVIAFDIKTGARRWVQQITPDDAFMDGCYVKPHANCPTGDVGPDFDLSGATMLVTLPNGQERLIVTSKSGEVLGLDADDRGRLLWRTRVGRGGLLGGIEWGGSADGVNAYVSVTDLGPYPASPGKADASPPMPGLYAVSTLTGAMMWRVPAPESVCSWGKPCTSIMHSAPASIPGVVFAGSYDGRMRAYATRDGRQLWEFDTGREFNGVNGGKAVGGSIDQGGQVLAGGRLFVASGSRNGFPGNALLAFGKDGP